MKLSDWLPYTKEGRQTLVYLTFAGAGPVLTAIVIWAMVKALGFRLFDVFANLSYVIAAGLLILITGLSMFVAIRSLKVSKDGLEATGGEKE